ncbi:MAG: molybdopterin-dependent oxidoreductase [bacterium]|nr:molybdopterin-dependent oxidoreductase [bacterium]
MVDRRLLVCVGLSLLLTLGCKKGLHEPAESLESGQPDALVLPDVEWTIELSGAGLGQPRSFTFEQLARMEMVRIDGAMFKKTHEPDERSSWRGPTLASLLEAAKIKPGSAEFTVEAIDGYEFMCMREDLASAIIALQDGAGRWLADVKPGCPVRLVPPDKPGNYWIVNVNRIVVEPVVSAAPPA